MSKAYNASQPRDPQGTSTGGQWSSGQLNAIESAARKGAGVAHTGLITDESARLDIFDELKVSRDEGAIKSEARQEIEAAVGDYGNDLFVQRNAQSDIVAAASFYKDGTSLIINHIGSSQAGEGLVVIKQLEQIARERGATRLEVWSRMAARDYWQAIGFAPLGNSANKFTRNIP